MSDEMCPNPVTCPFVDTTEPHPLSDHPGMSDRRPSNPKPIEDWLADQLRQRVAKWAVIGGPESHASAILHDLESEGLVIQPKSTEAKEAG